MTEFEKSSRVGTAEDDKGGEQKHNQGGLSSKKRGPDNTVVAMNKSKKGSKDKSSNELLQDQCSYHPYHQHVAADCQQLKKS